MISSDESRFCLNTEDQRICMWMRPRHGVHPVLVERQTAITEGVTGWGVICWNTRSSLAVTFIGKKELVHILQDSYSNVFKTLTAMSSRILRLVKDVIGDLLDLMSLHVSACKAARGGFAT
ncbi:hypothetical protein TNCV_351821 [Trichonephila clavipes]|nr:hypothetical protein TNCV_351821 [Trichonephila clavipes]